jgi:hypothetical protein
VLAVLSGAGLLATGVGAEGPASPAPRWPRGASVAVWIDPADAPERGVSLVARAVETWARAAGERLHLRQAGRPDEAVAAGVRVRFMKSGSLYGETVPRIDPRSGIITRAEVLVAADGRGDLLTTQIVVYLTALHELGHALGLVHSDRFEDIMYRFQAPDDGARYFGRYRGMVRREADIGAPQACGLSDDDVRALRTLYDDER